MTNFSVFLRKHLGNAVCLNIIINYYYYTILPNVLGHVPSCQSCCCSQFIIIPLTVGHGVFREPITVPHGVPETHCSQSLVEALSA